MSPDFSIFGTGRIVYKRASLPWVGHGRPQAWARGALAPPPSGNVVKCFCALVVTGKRSVDELFMHYFHNLSSASVGFAPRGPDQPGLHPGTPGKSPAGVHWAGCMLTHSFVLKY